VELRAQLALRLKDRGYHINFAASVSHACRICFAGIVQAAVATDGRSFEQELRASIPLVAALEQVRSPPGTP